jgi:putative aminopeptidase FrvX
MRNLLLERIEKEKEHWKKEPRIHYGDAFQDCIVLVFGEPRTAVFAHMDSVGFTVKNSEELVKIGGPKAESGYRLVGTDSQGAVECELKVEESEDERGRKHQTLKYDAPRRIDRGTSLTFKPEFREDEEYLQCCYMDDRMGVLNAFKVCEDLENGAVVFSAWEEHGGGSVEYLGRFLYETYGVHQALISDITWVTEDILHGEGVAVSMRDSGIPRRSYVERILEHAEQSGIPYQLEVEGAGGSDGIALQKSPYPFDWCFIGAAETGVHSPDEKVHKRDAEAMTELYRYLMERL